LPELGENIESGDVVKVLVSEGDTIAANDGVIELETDKAVVEIPCPHAGKVTKVAVTKGQTIKVGELILTIESEDGEPAEEAPPAKKPEKADEKPKAQQKPEAKQAAPKAEKRPEAEAEPKREGPPKPAAKEGGVVPAGPMARRVARELGVNLGSVSGSGNHGRITPEDVRAASRGKGAPAGKAAPMAEPYQPVTPPGEPSSDNWGSVRRDRLSKIRQTIAAQMVKSASTIPHLTNFDDADVTELEAVRSGVPQGFLGEGLKLTTMSFVIKSVALALRRHPMLNALLDEENQQIVYKEYVNIGIAVDTPRGLVVPVMRGVDRMNIPDVAASLKSIAERARAAQFAVEELRGGTFTISNLGAVGGLYSTPIINHPEVAILLLGRARWMPVVRDGQVVPRQMLPLSLSYDHRVVDGATAGRFLNEVIDWLQSPGKLLLV
ncbi:MAG: dihydrolipoamide acetyltransferase family protein, partial [Planctomycetota bacterium]